MEAHDPGTWAGDDHIGILDRDRCLELLQTVGIGRIAWASAAGEALVLPVNFVLDDGAVVIKTARGGLLAGAVREARTFTFEADDVEPAVHAGWSVLVTGSAQIVTAPDRIRHLHGLHLAPWTSFADPLFVRLAPQKITGRRLPLHPGGVTVDHLDQE